MMTNKHSRIIAYRWFMTDAYQTCSFQLKIYPFLLVDTENCFSFETECDFMLSYWSSLGIVLRATKTFSVSSWKVHFPLWYCTLLVTTVDGNRQQQQQQQHLCLPSTYIYTDIVREKELCQTFGNWDWQAATLHLLYLPMLRHGVPHTNLACVACSHKLASNEK